MSGSVPRLTKFADAITAVDTEYVRPQMDASHIVVSGSRAAIVDTGPNTAVPLILAALDELGVARDAVDFLFLTHVHLDHAGGAGALMRALPGATAVVHPRGAAHMSDPSKLIEATRAVYGDELYAQLYGEILPIAPERIAIAQDGQRFEFAGRVFECVHTPGHALHHQAIRRLRRHLHLHGGHLRALVPRIRHRRRAVDHAHHHADAIRSVAAQGVDRASHAVPTTAAISHALQRGRAVRPPGQRHV